MTRKQPSQTIYYTNLVRSFPTMSNKTVMITGCTSGTGLVLARTCGQLGAKIVMLNRASTRADDAFDLLKNEGIDAEFVPCDLLSFDSVRSAAKILHQRYSENGCDVLCNNAGIMGMADLASGEGYDIQMQANHLSHFLLTHLIWPLLVKASVKNGEARVVNHSSGARNKPSNPLMAKYLQANGGSLGGDRFPGLQKWVRYQQSKLANLMFTYALHDRASQENSDNQVKILCAHPGPTDSGLQAKTAAAGGKRLLDRYILSQTLKVAQSVEDGTSGIARCCCEPDVTSGEFYGPGNTGKGGPAILMTPVTQSTR
jgi:NAD(P)-dependent dehydrogenase (short-subunit alcohol dehydrogenase family)